MWRNVGSILDLTLLDYGFLYHRDNNFPQDDISWFLIEKEEIEMLKYCKKSVMPNMTDLSFDEGVCSAYNFYKDRKSINWSNKKRN